ncbi:MAG: hypothetical protein P9L88_04985 [Candidatus Tantalella remota]|nr:hypothetical protein [Candidatus Tantalella remota]
MTGRVYTLTRKAGYARYMIKGLLPAGILNAKGGWTINFDFLAAEKRLNIKLEKLKGDMVFMPNPLMSLKNIFYSDIKKEVTFVKKSVSMCDTISTRDVLDIPSIDCERLINVIGRFDGEKDLDAVLKEINDIRESDLSEDDFFSVVQVLDTHDIIVFKYIPKGVE